MSRAGEALVIFGLTRPGDSAEARGDAVRARCLETARRLDAELKPGEAALVCGPSGGGKSTILEMLRGCSGRCVIATPVRSGVTAMIDRFDGPLEDAMATLARAGLAEASLFGSAPRELSEGERHRLMLAEAMHRAQRTAERHKNTVVTVIVDEFMSCLDRLTAVVIARCIGRWVDGSQNIRFVAATSHDDLIEALRPGVLVYQPLAGDAVVLCRDGVQHKKTASPAGARDGHPGGRAAAVQGRRAQRTGGRPVPVSEVV